MNEAIGAKNTVKSMDIQNLHILVNIKELLEIHGNKCSVCFYNKCDSALQFHHIDPSQKEFEISESAYSLENLKAEAKKCILLCANCHAEVEKEILKSKIKLFYSKKSSKQFSLC
jgi:EAL domain-containing protein (putative c-di-GMP-specific phosphodiesterase class I)